MKVKGVSGGNDFLAGFSETSSEVVTINVTAGLSRSVPFGAAAGNTAPDNFCQ
jgi:hypothetical protein